MEGVDQNYIDNLKQHVSSKLENLELQWSDKGNSSAAGRGRQLEPGPVHPGGRLEQGE